MPVSPGSEEYRKTKEGLVKPAWHHVRSKKEEFLENEQEDKETIADGIMHEPVVVPQRLNDSRFDALPRDFTIRAIRRWPAAINMCRRVNNAAIKTTFDVHVKFVPHNRS